MWEGLGGLGASIEIPFVSEMVCGQNVFLDGRIDVDEPLGADAPSQ